MSGRNYYGQKYREESWAVGRKRRPCRALPLPDKDTLNRCTLHDYPWKLECPSCIHLAEERHDLVEEDF